MARSSREAAERTRATLLLAARDAFAQQGVHGVALEDVAARAGVTRGAVYHRWSSKRELVRAVVEQAMEEVAAAVEAAAERGEEDWARLRLGCLEFVRAATDPSIHRVLLVDGPTVLGWREWRELDAAASRRGLEALLAQLAARGELACPPDAAAVLLSGALNEGAMWVDDAGDPDVALAALATTLDALIDGLRARSR